MNKRNLVRFFLSLLIVFTFSAPSSSFGQSLCKVDYTDPNVSYVSYVAQQISSQIYRMDFIAGELCNHLDELVQSSGATPTLLAAFSMEFEALKKDIDSKSSASYVNFVPYPEYPQYKITLSDINRAYIANFLNTKRLMINQTTVAGDSYASIRRSACRATWPLHFASYYLALCK